MKRLTKLDRERLEAADEVCWTLMLMLALGGLDIGRSWKKFLAPNMEKWSQLAVDSGTMTEDGEPSIMAEDFMLEKLADKVLERLAEKEKTA